MQKQSNRENGRPPDTRDVLARIPGATEAAARIRDTATREALRELLRKAIELELQPQRIKLGKETGFGFGPKRYPLCRINTSKGIAFHGPRQGDALIIRATDDHSFRIATGILRRLALALALET